MKKYKVLKIIIILLILSIIFIVIKSPFMITSDGFVTRIDPNKLMGHDLSNVNRHSFEEQKNVYLINFRFDDIIVKEHGTERMCFTKVFPFIWHQKTDKKMSMIYDVKINNKEYCFVYLAP